METTANLQESKGFYKLSWLQRIGFGSGDLAQNLIFQTVATYLMIYLTTVLKINAAFVSGLILTVRLIDCFWSPVVGRYIDNRNPKLGKYRTYLLYGGIPLTVAACLLMLPQAATWSMPMKMIYAALSYTVLSMIYSVVNIPYGSIMASMTRDNDEVLILTSTRMVCANIGQIVVQAGFPIGLAMCVHAAIDWNQATFMAIGTIPAFIILPSMPILKKWLGKKGLYYTLLAVGLVGFAVLFTIGKFFDVSSYNTLVQIAKVMTGVGLLVGSLMWALVPEVITEAEYRTGNRPAATVNALAGVAFKAGFSIAGWITPLVMGWIGFNFASEESALSTDPMAWFTVTCVFAIVGFFLILFAAGTHDQAVKTAGVMRRMLGAAVPGHMDKERYEFCWIVDFPMYEIGEESGELEFCHNPFSMPSGGLEVLLKAERGEIDPLTITADQYDLVCNGVELSSGAVRNHDPEIMVKAFEMVRLGEEDVKKKFPAMYNAFCYGAPPHAGIAPGVDRMVMLLAGEDSIREVIPFPMNKSAQDVMMGAPSEVTQKQLDELHIAVVGKVEE